MSEPTVIHSTFTIEREYAATRERVFAALSEPELKRRWFADGEKSTVEEFTMDFRVGGTDVTSFRAGEESPIPNIVVTNRTTYLDIVPEERVVLAYTMNMGERRFSASMATFELRATGTGTGTLLVFTEQGAYFPYSDGPEIRKHGWTALLGQLAGVLGA
jgi:uncharacterized protein YndB with AHSA1/START domain